MHLQPDGALQQEAVAYGREMLTTYRYVTLYAEEFRLFALHQQAARIVA